jgi:uncharacterized membrane protein YfcA
VTWIDVTLATVAVGVGATLQGSIGFGLGLIGAPYLLLIDSRLIPGPLLVASMALTLSLAHRHRHSIIVSDLKWALSGRVAGIAVAVVALTALSRDGMQLTFGVLVLCGAAMSASGLHLEPGRTTLLGAGALSGFMGTSVSIGGPPMALLYQNASGPQIRGTLSAYFLVGVMMSLVGLRVAGRFGLAELLLAASLLPGVLLGFLISRHTAGFLDRGYTRVGVLSISAATGVAVIVRQMF